MGAWPNQRGGPKSGGGRSPEFLGQVKDGAGGSYALLLPALERGHGQADACCRRCWLSPLGLGLRKSTIISLCARSSKLTSPCPAWLALSHCHHFFSAALRLFLLRCSPAPSALLGHPCSSYYQGSFWSSTSLRFSTVPAWCSRSPKGSDCPRLCEAQPLEVPGSV